MYRPTHIHTYVHVCVCVCVLRMCAYVCVRVYIMPISRIQIG